MCERKSASVFPELVPCDRFVPGAVKRRANGSAVQVRSGARMEYPAFFAASVLSIEALALALALLTLSFS